MITIHPSDKLDWRYYGAGAVVLSENEEETAAAMPRATWHAARQLSH